MKTLITGIAGFAGSHLAELLLDGGDEVSGTILPGETTRNIESIKSHVQLFPCDIRDADAAKSLIARTRPDEIYHLAALAFIPDSIAAPRLTFDINLYGTLNVFEAARMLESPPQVLFVGSADEYGRVREDELPVTEDNPLRPLNPYSVSKVSAGMLAYQYGVSTSLRVVRVRPFNHTGPRQSPQFVCSDFARQIVEAEKGRRPPQILVGNLKPKRDFTDVRDIVRAYRDILRRGESVEVYNICSGKAIEIGEILDLLLEISGHRFNIVAQPERARGSDVSEIRGDYGKLRSVIDWNPTIPLNKTLSDMIEYWRGF
ncbi:MAG: GDP-mannose 4,6-dehydratase [Candidatus Abyssubacteria bacterium]